VSDLALDFRRRLTASRLVRPGSTVLVALSGGCDSVVLLRLLLDVAPALRLRVAAAHLDHRMRGDSVADAAWVAELCRAWDVELAVGALREPARSEAHAREARYVFLRAAARQTRASRIATGHHADDDIETLVLRLARGTGTRGLRGIPERRGPLVRPLLPYRRSVLETWAREAGIAWREDPSNARPVYARNQVRLELLPALRGLDAALPARLEELRRDARRVERAWRARLDGVEAECVRATDGGFDVAREPLLAYPPAVQKRLLRRLLRRLRVVPTRAGTEAALAFMRGAASGRRIDVGGGAVLERCFDVLRVRAPAGHPMRDAAPAEPDSLRIDCDSGAGSLDIGGRKVRVSWSRATRVAAGGADVPGGRILPDGPRAAEVRVTGGAGAPLELRGWRPGDRMRLHGGTSKLKKLFNEWRVPRHERARVPLLAEGGRVLWVAGHARAADADDGRAARVLRIRVIDADVQ